MITSKTSHVNSTAKTENLLIATIAAYQLIPERSTAAINIHHPQAKYDSVGECRVGQLMK